MGLGRRIRFGLLAALALAGVPALARGQAPDAPKGEGYALLVGVKKYDKSSEMRPLRYTERDVVELAKVLRVGGYRPENIVLMTEAAGAEETRFLPIGAKVRKE